jgi:hypothetical protein
MRLVTMSYRHMWKLSAWFQSVRGNRADVRDIELGCSSVKGVVRGPGLSVVRVGRFWGGWFLKECQR